MRVVLGIVLPATTGVGLIILFRLLNGQVFGIGARTVCLLLFLVLKATVIPAIFFSLALELSGNKIFKANKGFGAKNISIYLFGAAVLGTILIFYVSKFTWSNQALLLGAAAGLTTALILVKTRMARGSALVKS